MDRKNRKLLELPQIGMDWFGTDWDGWMVIGNGNGAVGWDGLQGSDSMEWHSQATNKEQSMRMTAISSLIRFIASPIASLIH